MSKYILIFFVIITSCGNKDNKIVISDKSMESTINMGATITYKKVDKIERNDIIIFNLPNSDKPTCLRVIGFPNDKIEIVKGEILINDKEYNRVNSSNMIYTVYSKEPTNFSKLREYNFKPYSDNYGLVCITKKQLDEITNKKLVDSIYLLGFDSAYVYPGIVKVRTSKYFNHYYFGPIFIPEIGDTILKEDKMLIEGFSNFDANSFIINDTYYFCIGDSFSDAMDSRIFGLIPKNKILGKVSYIKNVNVLNVETE